MRQFKAPGSQLDSLNTTSCRLQQHMMQWQRRSWQPSWTAARSWRRIPAPKCGHQTTDIYNTNLVDTARHLIVNRRTWRPSWTAGRSRRRRQGLGCDRSQLPASAQPASCWRVRCKKRHAIVPTDHGIDLKKWCVYGANRTSRARAALYSVLRPLSGQPGTEEQALQQRTVSASRKHRRDAADCALVVAWQAPLPCGFGRQGNIQQCRHIIARCPSS